ncbi:MAG: L-fucose:H+ symporter permease [Bacteroidaceae bacterium]|nr:L-fucose:H+ symporter permease [Bacteroidaceae bacterium]
MSNNQKSKTFTVALSMVICLFFLWAISNNLLSSVVKKMMTLFDIDQAKAEFVETSYWFAYFLFPIPIAMFMKRFSYKAGIVLGLLIAAVGGLLFMPVTRMHSFPLYLCAFFIVAIGMCFLETAANPYVTELGDPATAPRRLNLAQAFNGLGAFIAAMFLSKIILGTEATRTAEQEIHTFRMTYAIFAIVLIVIAIVFIFTHLPRIQAEDADEGNTKLISFKVLKRSHLRNGVIAQFFYNGGQTAVNSLFLVYCINYVGMTNSQATTFFGFYMLFFLLGRWVGTTLMVKFRPENMLVFYGIANVLLCIVVCVVGGKAAVYAMMGISFFMSIMYPTQFSLALTDLKGDTKSGSAFLVMAIVGNSILPILTAYVQKSMANPNIAYAIPLICFAVCAWYGWRGHKVID